MVDFFIYIPGIINCKLAGIKVESKVFGLFNSKNLFLPP